MTKKEKPKLTPFAGKDPEPNRKTETRDVSEISSPNRATQTGMCIYDISRTGLHHSGTGKSPTVAERR
jgi:hypothetical protein